MVLAARRIEILKDLASRLSRQYGVQTLPVKTDLTVLDDIRNLFQETREKFGKLNVLVNVAGEFPAISFVYSDPNEFIDTHEKAVNLMLNAVVYASKLGLDMLLENNGIIINISSDAGLEKKVYPDQVPYHSAKAGVNHATRAIDLETRDRGIRAFAIAPGNIDTPLLRKTIEGNPELVDLITRKAGSLEKFYSRILKPGDIADKVLDLVTNPQNYQDPVIEMESFEF